MSRASFTNAVLGVTTATALALSSAAVAGAQNDPAANNSGAMAEAHANNSRPAPAMGPQPTVTTPQGLRIQNMGDVLGPYSQHVGFRSGDLGAMAPLDNGGFAIVFGDSFTGSTVYQGEHLTPVGVVAQMNDGMIDIQRPLNKGTYVKGLTGFLPERDYTQLPSDIININGALYMQVMSNRGLHNVDYTQIWKSTDNGQSWRRITTNRGRVEKRQDDLISWEKGPDGWVYIASTSFTRENPLFLWAARPENIANPEAWKMLNLNTGDWGTEGTPILDKNPDGSPLAVGEMNLRYIDGHWVLVVFNATKGREQIEVRISKHLARDWNDVPVAVIAKNGPWNRAQTPMNWSQPYGGYIVPGSTLNDMDIIVSQWNTGTHNRYMATQFNVKGLETFFDLKDEDGNPIPAVETRKDIPTKPVYEAINRNPSGGSSQSSSGSSITGNAAQDALVIVTALTGIIGLAATAWPTIRPLLPKDLQEKLPF